MRGSEIHESFRSWPGSSRRSWRCRKVRRESGGVLLIVLVVILVGGAISTGWVAVMSAETAYVETMTESAKRRVAAGNAKGLAQQYLLTRLLTKSVSSAAAFTADLGEGWGTMTIPAISAAVKPMAVTSAPQGWNHFNPAEGAGFSHKVTVGMTGGDRDFLLRSYATELAGTLLVRNRPTLSPAAASGVEGSMLVSGEALLWETGAGSMTAGSFNAPTTPLPEVAVVNFPFVNRTTGEIGGEADYDGRLNVVDALAAKVSGSQVVRGSEVSTVTGVTSDLGGTLTFDLGDPNLERVLIDGGTTAIVFTGQTTVEEGVAAGNAIAVLVVFQQALGESNLATVDFTGFSNRKLLFAVRKADGSLGAVNFNFGGPAMSKWRGLFTVENAEVNLNVGGSTREIVGGWRSDRKVSVLSGSVIVSRDPQPRLLDQLAAREGWLEVFTP